MGERGITLPSGDPGRAAIQLAFGCDDTLARSIAALGREAAHPRGAVLWPQSDRDGAVLMLTGRAQEVAYGRDGAMLLLHLLGPGDLFGDLLDDGGTVGQVEAVDHGRGAHFANVTILRLMESYSCVGLAISRQLAQRLASLRQRMIETALLSVTGRICSELLRRSADQPDRIIRPMPVMTELATSVQSTRETVSRTVSQLERRGIVKRVGGGLAIIAPHRLEEQAY